MEIASSSSKPPSDGHSLSKAATPKSLTPFLKWPGGKRWAAQQIASIVHEKLRKKYLEPFLGGAAVFFYLRPSKAILSDINPDLINTYRAVRDHPARVINALRDLHVSDKDYYRIRSTVPASPTLRAARFLYLNRTAFGGMYRLNKDGHFNVPFGGGERTPDIFFRTAILRNASLALHTAKLMLSDFEAILNEARGGDVVYCDPTYTVTHDQNGFIRYNEQSFSWSDQERLATAAARARRRGAAVIVSNAHHEEVRKIYRRATLWTLTRKSTLSADPSKRRTVYEYLIIL